MFSGLTNNWILNWDSDGRPSRKPGFMIVVFDKKNAPRHHIPRATTIFQPKIFSIFRVTSQKIRCHWMWIGSDRWEEENQANAAREVARNTCPF